MNIAFFVKPKSMVTYLYGDHSLTRGLSRLRESGYSALPVLSRDGKYLGTVSEGDFLWYLADRKARDTAPRDAKIRDLLHTDRAKAMPVTTSMEELLRCATEQSFVPVVDDVGSFIGIVVRSDLIRYFADRVAAPPRERATVPTAARA
ncbi:MAG: CBS domain-containing protein [Clostridia bacterium]|nr:CBS domain-containing protein [Clostridia bacterium]